MKYQYREFVERRDLQQFIEDSAPILEAMGVDPLVFYTALNEHPEILDLEPEEAINELLGWMPDAARAVGAGLKGFGAGMGVRNAQNNIDLYNSMSPEERQRLGISDADLERLNKEKASAQASQGRGFLGNMAQGWQQARQNRAANQRQAQLAALQQHLGRGSFAPNAATNNASRPAGTTAATQQARAPQQQQDYTPMFDALNGRIDQLEKLVRSMQQGSGSRIATPTPQQVQQYGQP